MIYATPLPEAEPEAQPEAKPDPKADPRKNLLLKLIKSKNLNFIFSYSLVLFKTVGIEDDYIPPAYRVYGYGPAHVYNYPVYRYYNVPYSYGIHILKKELICFIRI